MDITDFTLTVVTFVHLQYCSGTFLQRATLEKHTESFHVELQCGYCGSTFVGTESVVEHVKDAHQASKVTSTENYQDMGDKCGWGQQTLYRVGQVVVDLGWVDLDFEVP